MCLIKFHFLLIATYFKVTIKNIKMYFLFSHSSEQEMHHKMSKYATCSTVSVKQIVTWFVPVCVQLEFILSQDSLMRRQKQYNAKGHSAAACRHCG
jgi:hypothetical protein